MRKTKFSSAIDSLEKVLQVVSVTCLLLIMAGIVVEVILRKVVHISILGLIDFIEEYLMIALVFLAMSYVYKIGGHVRVTLFTRFIPKGIKAPTDIILNILGLGYFALIVLFGWGVFQRALEFHEKASNILAYPLAPAYLLVPLGCGLLCVRILQFMFVPMDTFELPEE